MNDNDNSKTKGYSSLKKSPRASGGSPRIENKRKWWWSITTLT